MIERRRVGDIIKLSCLPYELRGGNAKMESLSLDTVTCRDELLALATVAGGASAVGDTLAEMSCVVN